MLFPESETERANFLEALMAAGWADALQKPEISSRLAVSPKFAAHLATAPRFDRDLKARVLTARLRGRTAGFMLHFILNCSHFDAARRYASVSAACRVVSTAQAGVRGFDSKTVKRFIWDVYKPVAHLWAAAWAWHVEMGRGDDIDHLPENDLDAFLSLAEEFRRVGENWRHDRGPVILDHERTWKAPPDMPLPPLCYMFRRVSQDLLDAARG